MPDRRMMKIARFRYMMWFYCGLLSMSPQQASQAQVAEAEGYLKKVRWFPDYSSSPSDAYLSHPFDLAMYKGSYFVSDAVQNCVKVFSSQGRLVRTIGGRGRGPGELIDPFELTINPENAVIYCQDGGNRRISCFSVNGKYIRSFRTVNAVFDLIAYSGKIVTTSYNEQTKTLFAVYDSLGSILKLFGSMFDPRVNQLSYRSFLYSNVYFQVDKENLYVFYAYIPTIQVYEADGQLRETINIDMDEVKELYEQSLQSRESLRIWLRGVVIEDGKFFCYSPPLAALLVLDKSGRVVKRLKFENQMTERELYFHNFRGKKQDEYYFVDVDNAQVEVYTIVETW
jgi:hypothetical protein